MKPLSSTPEFWRTVVAWVMVLALGAHGLIPVGYMPELGAKTAGLFAITICHGSSKQQIFVDADMKRVDPATQKQKPADQNAIQKNICGFSLNNFFTSAGLTPPLLHKLSFTLLILMGLVSAAFIQRRCYGNASSRSPPLVA